MYMKLVEHNCTRMNSYSCNFKTHSDSPFYPILVHSTFPTPESWSPHAEGEDYIGEEFSASFSPGQTKASFRIPIINDDVFEPDETFSLSLEIPKQAQDFGVVIGDPCILNGIISNDEGGCLLMFHCSKKQNSTFLIFYVCICIFSPFESRP